MSNRQINRLVEEAKKRKPAGVTQENQTMPAILSQVGNRAVQRALSVPHGSHPQELDDETESRIEEERRNGASLNTQVQTRLESVLGHDFSHVRVHTSPAADDLNRQLGARAFASGSDIYFRDGMYDPESLKGQQLLAHELTHVIQQDSGQVVGGEGEHMKVTSPGDHFETEADQISDTATQMLASPSIMREIMCQNNPPEDEIPMEF